MFTWLRKNTESFWVLLNCGFRCSKVASSDECFHMPFNKLWVFHPLIWVNTPYSSPTAPVTQPLELQHVCSDSAQLPGPFKILKTLFKAWTFLKIPCHLIAEEVKKCHLTQSSTEAKLCIGRKRLHLYEIPISKPSRFMSKLSNKLNESSQDEE